MQIIITDPETRQAIACHGRTPAQINKAISELSDMLDSRIYISVYPETASEKAAAYGYDSNGKAADRDDPLPVDATDGEYARAYGYEREI